jgi:hypothetical protein
MLPMAKESAEGLKAARRRVQKRGRIAWDALKAEWVADRECIDKERKDLRKMEEEEKEKFLINERDYMEM